MEQYSGEQIPDQENPVAKQRAKEVLNEHDPVPWPDAPEAVSNHPTITVPRCQDRGVMVDVRHLRPQDGDSSDIGIVGMEGNLAAGTQPFKTATTQVCAPHNSKSRRQRSTLLRASQQNNSETQQ